MDKYGAGQDAYCYPGTSVLRNKLGIEDDEQLSRAERDLSEIGASQIDFDLPPYDLAYLKRIHLILFQDIYDWAGEIRRVDISKAATRFCNVNRVEAEALKIFTNLQHADWYEGCSRDKLITLVAECFGDLNMIHPFREGNGRAQRILFEHLIVNAGFEINWWNVNEQEWISANIDAVVCDYSSLQRIFERCIGAAITD